MLRRATNLLFPMRTCTHRYCSSLALEADLNIFAEKKQTLVSLRNLMETGNGSLLQHFEKFLPQKTGDMLKTLDRRQRVAIQIACFLHRELAVRVAHRAVSLQATPAFKASAHIQLVCEMYKGTFAELRLLQVPSTVETEKVFAICLQNIYDRHAATLLNMAKGANEIRLNLIKESNDQNVVLQDEIQAQLNEFYSSRIAIRTLLAQYLALRQPASDDMIGLVDLKTSVHDIAMRAVGNAEYICRRAHGDSPPVEIIGRSDLVFPYIPSHIEYILVELLKNSMRATVETHGLDDLRPIKIIIADGEDNEEVVIKVSDEGGGIKRSEMSKIWSYLYTTGDPAVLASMLGVDEDGQEVPIADFSNSAPLAGLGYGLPIAKNYAKFFGGDLIIMSMEGYGTDSFIYLPILKLDSDGKCRKADVAF